MSDSEGTSLAVRLGRIIRDERTRQGLRLADLSLLSGVAVPTLSDLENASRDTRLSSYQRVLDALSLNLDVLIKVAPAREFSDLDDEGYDLGAEP